MPLDRTLTKTTSKYLSLGCALVTLFLLGGALVLYTQCGANAGTALWVWLTAALAVYGPGSALRQWLCPDAPSEASGVLTVVFGGAGFALSALAASWTKVHALVWVWTLLGWCVWAAQHRKGDRRTAHFSGSSVWILAAVTAGYVFLNALWAVRYVHPSVVTVARPSQDFFWNLGNTQSLLQGFPMADLRVAGVTVSYHFLTELIGAGMCMLSGAPAYDVVAFYGYAPVAAAMVICLYGLGRCLWGKDSRVRPLVLSLLPLWMGCASLWKVLANGLGRFGNVLLIYVVSNINGQATALAALAGFFAVFALLERNGWQGKAGLWAGAIAGFYLLTFAKSPQAAVLALALLGALLLRGLFGLRTKQRVPTGLLCFFALVPLGFWLVFGLFFSSGADSSMTFSLTGTLGLYFFGSILQALRIRFAAGWQLFLPILWLAQTLLAAPAAFCVWVVSGVRDLFHLRQVSALRLTWHACIVGGVLAFFWFDHYSSSQLYFFMLALFCMGLVLLDRLPGLWQSLTDTRGRLRIPARTVQTVCAVLLAVGCLTSGFTLVWLLSTAPAELAGGTPDQRYFPLTAQEKEACAWLGQNMEPGTKFATNRMHTGTALEGLSNVYSGLSGRQAYCESFKYAVSNMGDKAGDVMARYDLVNRIFDPNTPESEIRRLCEETGTGYLVYHAASQGSDAQLSGFEKVYTSDIISVYKVS